MEALKELLRDIDKHLRAEWYAGRLPAECWPKSLSDRLAAAVAGPGILSEREEAKKRRCQTMDRPSSLCGCPDCGSSLVDVPTETTPAPPGMPAAWMLVEDLVRAECTKTRVHQRYMGKCMPADVYAQFQRLRDERVPALRARLRHVLAFLPVVPEPVVPLCWVNEDELPKSMSNEAYAALFPHSKVDVVRMFPIFAAPQGQAEDIADLVTGMSVSVDVSTGDDDAGNRYFGTVTLAQEDINGKHGLILLVQDAEPNFTFPAQAAQGGM